MTTPNNNVSGSLSIQQPILPASENVTYVLTNSVLAPGPFLLLTGPAQVNNDAPINIGRFATNSASMVNNIDVHNDIDEPNIIILNNTHNSSLKDPLAHEDPSNEVVIIENSNSDNTEDSPEIQKKLIQEFHDYSLSPAKYGKLAVQNTVNAIKKKLKAAQQRHRRLENRVTRLKEVVAKLKRKNVRC